MDFVNKVIGGSSEKKENQEGKSSGGGGIMDKLNAKAGGGKESEKDEDALDKGKHLLRCLWSSPNITSRWRPRIDIV